MIQVLFWGFTAKNLREAVSEICEQNPNAIWVGKSKKCDFSIVDFYEYRIDRLEDFTNIGVEIELDSDQKNRIYCVLQREFIAWQYSHIDLHQVMTFYVQWFSNFLLNKDIKKIWFAYIPHQGAELILYYVAKFLNIKTNMFYQSLFKNKVFLIEDIDALGEIFNEKGEYSLFAEKIEYGMPEQDLFYMKNLPKTELHWIWLYKHIKNRFKSVIKGKASLFSVVSLAHMGYMRRQWLKSQKNMIWDDIDIREKEYIYFPLHLQPELTTDPLGGCFGDQALAIEQLRKKVPNQIAIVIKENPKQFYEWRGGDFLNRIRRLENVFWVNSSFNTYSLLKNAKAVATITGTAGWEAVIAGKPAIVFGAAWYKQLPGVFCFNEGDFSWENIVEFDADFDSVQEKLDILASHMPEIVTDLHYIAIFPEYDPDENKQALIQLLSK